ncbi:MAG: hypothetical protein EOP83_35725 [Verrucomicrobiaceae bacterium]|nr:MAG: hypothetical protein EOP83_35725 [Verrucomicrobiaceae bacterium]
MALTAHQFWIFVTGIAPQQMILSRGDGGLFHVHEEVVRGPEYEFVQVTTPPNELIAKITDRMLLLLREDDLDLWLGALRAPLEDVKELIKTTDFDPDEWDISVEDPTKKPPKPRKPKAKTPPPQGDLF